MQSLPRLPVVKATPASQEPGVLLSASSAHLPASSVPTRTIVLGLFGLLAAVSIVWSLNLQGLWAAWICTLATALPMWLAEAGRLRHRDTPRTRVRPSPVAWALLCLPWLACLALFAWAYPPFNTHVWLACLPALLMIMWIFSKWGRDADLDDLDRYVQHQRVAFPWHALRNQAVKAFYLPLMLTFFTWWWDGLSGFDLGSTLAWFYLAVSLIFLLDVGFAAAGYLPTPPGTGAGIRSSNPHWDAWVSTLACYPPFWLWISHHIRYEDGLDWSYHVPHGLPAYVWGGVILGLLAIYSWATVVFGPRFSNLTWRGVITMGPYKWLRHPAYVTKNLSWWLIAMPFVPALGWRETAFAVLCLLGINTLYWARAVTEERHLLRYAEYRRYYRYTERHGLHRFWRKWLNPPRKGELAWHLYRRPLLLPIVLFFLAISALRVPSPNLEASVLLTLDQHGVNSSTVLALTPNTHAFARVQSALSTNLSPLNPQQPFPFFSLSKPLTAYIVLSEARAGRLSLTDPVVRWLPEVNIGSDSLTIAHLLSHRSGLLFQRDSTDPLLDPNHPNGGLDCEHALREIRGMSAPAGEVLRYQNINYCLLEKVLERASGADYLSLLGRYFPEIAQEAQHAALADSQCRRWLRLGAAGGFCFTPTTLLPVLQKVVTEYADLIAEPLADLPTTYGLGFRTWREGQDVVYTHYGYLDGNFSLFMATREGNALLLYGKGTRISPEILFQSLYQPLKGLLR